MAKPRSRVAERIRRAVAALQVNLMRTFALERDEKIRIERDAAGRVDVDLGDPSANAVGIELLVQRRVERVGHVDTAAVTADFEHLRRAIDLAGLGMRRARG